MDGFYDLNYKPTKLWSNKKEIWFLYHTGLLNLSLDHKTTDNYNHILKFD